VKNLSVERLHGIRRYRLIQHHETANGSDTYGAVRCRYRKYNLFGEAGFDVTPTAELSTFDTDFGVRFGMATCFDIYFHDPIIQLVQEMGVKDIVFPVAWFSELPFLTGKAL
jgi:predicted amidohydrolase